MSYSHILFHVEESGIALLTVNRPEKLNALSHALMGELADAFVRVSSQAEIRAVIVTGAAVGWNWRWRARFALPATMPRWGNRK